MKNASTLELIAALAVLTDTAETALALFKATLDPPERFWFCRLCHGIMPLDDALERHCIAPLGSEQCPLPPDVF